MTPRLGLVRQWPPVLYGAAVFGAIAAGALRASLTPFFHDRNELLMFYPVIMFAAWLGGLWPGIAATVASAATDAYLFLDPIGTLRLTHHSDKFALAVFVVTGVVISVLNENLRRNAERERSARADAERARLEAVTANRTKDFFLAAVSHDLRAPMTATLGWVDMLGRDLLDQNQRERAINAIRRSVDRQMVLVNDLLDTAAIVSGKLRVEQRILDVDRVVRAAFEMAQPLATAKDILLELESEPLDAMVLGDAVRLQQVVVNLLTNAIKFTPSGGSVRVRARSTDMAEIEVIDTGNGLAASAVARVFDEFWQSDDSTPLRGGGVGLGLAIAKHLVAAHGGTIEAVSAGEGQGTSFTVRLPLAQAGVPAAGGNAVARSG